MGIKISELPNITLPYGGNELIPMVQSTETRASSLSSLVNFLSGALAADIEILPTVTNYLSTNNVLLSGATITSTIQGLTSVASGRSSVALGEGNIACGIYSTIAGGFSSRASGSNSTIGGGICNTASCSNSTIGGGICNTACGINSTVAGGICNTACGGGSTASGGYCNTACGNNSTVAGGFSGRVSGDSSSILGGACNDIRSTATCASIIAGGSIIALSANTAYAPCLVLTSVPTVSSGLGPGSIWRCTTSNQLYIVP